jgi:uncharacterized protein (DUF1810 family)
MNSGEFHLDRFLDAQKHFYDIALEELRAGKKRSHWIWYVFPQLRGLGVSATANTYGLMGLTEARAYLTHPILGKRLKEATAAMFAHRSRKADSILGELDAMKFRSCLTLFSLADPSEQIFTEALECFFGGEPDVHTIKFLENEWQE